MDNIRPVSDYFRDEFIRVSRVTPIPGSSAYLLSTGSKAALVDSGFAFCADEMIKNIKAVLGERPLDYILLTHSHYDHASGTGRCRLAYKNLKVVASEYAAKILSKPSALSVICKMNESAAEYYGAKFKAGDMGDLSVDIIVREGDTIDLGDATLRVMEAPGHTKCCLSFYIPQNRTLISCETLGASADGYNVAPGFLVSFKSSVEYIRRLLELEIENLLVPHYGMLKGPACSEFISRALEAAESLKDLIVGDYLKGKTEKEIIEHYKEVWYTGEVQGIQPLRAFYMNAAHIVPMVINELAE